MVLQAQVLDQSFHNPVVEIVTHVILMATQVVIVTEIIIVKNRTSASIVVKLAIGPLSALRKKAKKILRVKNQLATSNQANSVVEFVTRSPSINQMVFMLIASWKAFHI